ncbi:MAG: phosphate/phosphite/phosphonate ABC transporter substrate-binding protein [Methylophilaceae bacterium]|nr:phosphate/phosphite/phosphonate ABC transporter substrate-binding protein [Methylophilaceae bacterium]
MSNYARLLTWMLVVLLAACDQGKETVYQPEFAAKGEDDRKEYVVGIHPLHNPQRLLEVYGPIVEYLDAQIPEARFRLEASRNYEEFDRKLDAGHFDFAMPNPYQTVRALRHGYRIFGKMADDENFRGIILVRRDSGIHEVADLKGRKVSYPAKTALAATMLPQYFLHTHGLDVNRDIENVYVGSQESSIMNVYLGHVAAAATWPVPWTTFQQEHPDMAGQLEVKWQTEPLQNNGWVVRADVPDGVAQRVAVLLFSMHQSAQGRQMLQRIPVSRFEPATEETYQPVRQFLDVFSKTVRPIEP